MTTGLRARGHRRLLLLHPKGRQPGCRGSARGGHDACCGPSGRTTRSRLRNTAACAHTPHSHGRGPRTRAGPWRSRNAWTRRPGELGKWAERGTGRSVGRPARAGRGDGALSATDPPFRPWLVTGTPRLMRRPVDGSIGASAAHRRRPGLTATWCSPVAVPARRAVRRGARAGARAAAGHGAAGNPLTRAASHPSP